MMTINILVKLLRIMPHRMALCLGRIIGRILHLVLWKKVDRCEAKCVKALGVGVTLAREIVRESFLNLGMSAVEFVRLPVMLGKIEELMSFPEESQRVLRSALSREKGVLLMTSHMANWEMAAARVIHAGFPLHAVFTSQREQEVNELILDVRNSFGMYVIDSDKVMREIFRVLKANGIVVIMQDLDARREGVMSEFLGLPASTHDGIVKLARKFGSAIVPVHYVRDKNNPAHHVVEMPEILNDRPGFGDDMTESLKVCNDVIGEWIRERPELWLWLMDRWESTLGKNV
ncbi:MAG: lysophospholipid acyltransferase family protein [Synergistaceae bacterium]|nr:lysophospholipid acyltransferase family protein [Synergistaceae bacterium]